MSSATGFERALPETGFGQAPASVVVATPRTHGPIDSPMHATDAKLIRFFAIAAFTTVLASIGMGIVVLLALGGWLAV